MVRRESAHMSDVSSPAYVHRISHFFISDDAPIHRIIFASSLSIRARMSNISVVLSGVVAVLSAFRALKASGVGQNASSSFIPKVSLCIASPFCSPQIESA
jgi:hypothetical protein